MTERLINKILPFSNTLVILHISGTVLKEALKHSISEHGWGGWLQFAGVRLAGRFSARRLSSKRTSARRLASNCETQADAPCYVGAQVCEKGKFTPGVGCSSWVSIQNGALGYLLSVAD